MSVHSSYDRVRDTGRRWQNKRWSSVIISLMSDDNVDDFDEYARRVRARLWWSLCMPVSQCAPLHLLLVSVSLSSPSTPLQHAAATAPLPLHTHIRARSALALPFAASPAARDFRLASTALGAVHIIRAWDRHQLHRICTFC